MLQTVRTTEIKREYAELFARQTIGYLVRRTTALMARRLNETLAKHEITLSHWVVLCCLWQKDGLPVMYIASQLQHIGGTLSDLLSRMEKRKLIKRKRDKRDRRILRVYLTDEGSALSQKIPPVVHAEWHHAWQDLTSDELHDFSKILDFMIHKCEPGYSVCLPEHCDQIAEEYQFILPPRSIGYRLKLLQLLLSRRFTDEVAQYNVTSSHTLVLLRLWQEDGIPVTEIGSYLEQVGGSLTGVLERMEERGLITRKQDEKDKRSYRVWLTSEGEGLIEVIPPICMTVLRSVTEGLKEEETSFFKNCLNRMLERASER